MIRQERRLVEFGIEVWLLDSDAEVVETEDLGSRIWSVYEQDFGGYRLHPESPSKTKFFKSLFFLNSLSFSTAHLLLFFYFFVFHPFESVFSH